MAFKIKSIIDLKGILFLMLLTATSQATNLDCNGKAFHCINSTHFMICVDLGGISTTIDDVIIQCPSPTVCQNTNRFECEFSVPHIHNDTTSTVITASEVTTDISLATIPYDDYLNTVRTTTLPESVSQVIDDVAVEPSTQKTILNSSQSENVTEELLVNNATIVQGNFYVIPNETYVIDINNTVPISLDGNSFKNNTLSLEINSSSYNQESLQNTAAPPVNNDSKNITLNVVSETNNQETSVNITTDINKIEITKGTVPDVGSLSTTEIESTTILNLIPIIHKTISNSSQSKNVTDELLVNNATIVQGNFYVIPNETYVNDINNNVTISLDDNSSKNNTLSLRVNSSSNNQESLRNTTEPTMNNDSKNIALNVVSDTNNQESSVNITTDTNKIEITKGTVPDVGSLLTTEMESTTLLNLNSNSELNNSGYNHFMITPHTTTRFETTTDATVKDIITTDYGVIASNTSPGIINKTSLQKSNKTIPTDFYNATADIRSPNSTTLPELVVIDNQNKTGASSVIHVESSQSLLNETVSSKSIEITSTTETSNIIETTYKNYSFTTINLSPDIRTTAYEVTENMRGGNNETPDIMSYQARKPNTVRNVTGNAITTTTSMDSTSHMEITTKPSTTVYRFTKPTSIYEHGPKINETLINLSEINSTVNWNDIKKRTTEPQDPKLNTLNIPASSFTTSVPIIRLSTAMNAEVITTTAYKETMATNSPDVSVNVKTINMNSTQAYGDTNNSLIQDPVTDTYTTVPIPSYTVNTMSEPKIFNATVFDATTEYLISSSITNVPEPIFNEYSGTKKNNEKDTNASNDTVNLQVLAETITVNQDTIFVSDLAQEKVLLDFINNDKVKIKHDSTTTLAVSATPGSVIKSDLISTVTFTETPALTQSSTAFINSKFQADHLLKQDITAIENTTVSIGVKSAKELDQLRGVNKTISTKNTPQETAAIPININGTIKLSTGNTSSIKKESTKTPFDIVEKFSKLDMENLTNLNADNHGKYYIYALQNDTESVDFINTFKELEGNSTGKLVQKEEVQSIYNLDNHSESFISELNVKLQAATISTITDEISESVIPELLSRNNTTQTTNKTILNMHIEGGSSNTGPNELLLSNTIPLSNTSSMLENVFSKGLNQTNEITYLPNNHSKHEIINVTFNDVQMKSYMDTPSVSLNNETLLSNETDISTVNDDVIANATLSVVEENSTLPEITASSFPTATTDKNISIMTERSQIQFVASHISTLPYLPIVVTGTANAVHASRDYAATETTQSNLDETINDMIDLSTEGTNQTTTVDNKSLGTSVTTNIALIKTNLNDDSKNKTSISELEFRSPTNVNIMPDMITSKPLVSSFPPLDLNNFSNTKAPENSNLDSKPKYVTANTPVILYMDTNKPFLTEVPLVESTVSSASGSNDYFISDLTSTKITTHAPTTGINLQQEIKTLKDTSPGLPIPTTTTDITFIPELLESLSQENVTVMPDIMTSKPPLKSSIAPLDLKAGSSTNLLTTPENNLEKVPENNAHNVDNMESKYVTTNTPIVLYKNVDKQFVTELPIPRTDSSAGESIDNSISDLKNEITTTHVKNSELKEQHGIIYLPFIDTSTSLPIPVENNVKPTPLLSLLINNITNTNLTNMNTNLTNTLMTNRNDSLSVKNNIITVTNQTKTLTMKQSENVKPPSIEKSRLSTIIIKDQQLSNQENQPTIDNIVFGLTKTPVQITENIKLTERNILRNITSDIPRHEIISMITNQATNEVINFTKAIINVMPKPDIVSKATNRLVPSIGNTNPVYMWPAKNYTNNTANILKHKRADITKSDSIKETQPTKMYVSKNITPNTLISTESTTKPVLSTTYSQAIATENASSTLSDYDKMSTETLVVITNSDYDTTDVLEKNTELSSTGFNSYSSMNFMEKNNLTKTHSIAKDYDMDLKPGPAKIITMQTTENAMGRKNKNMSTVTSNISSIVKPYTLTTAALPLKSSDIPTSAFSLMSSVPSTVKRIPSQTEPAAINSTNSRLEPHNSLTLLSLSEANINATFDNNFQVTTSKTNSVENLPLAILKTDSAIVSFDKNTQNLTHLNATRRDIMKKSGTIKVTGIKTIKPTENIINVPVLSVKLLKFESNAKYFVSSDVLVVKDIESEYTHSGIVSSIPKPTIITEKSEKSVKRKPEDPGQSKTSKNKERVGDEEQKIKKLFNVELASLQDKIPSSTYANMSVTKAHLSKVLNDNSTREDMIIKINNNAFPVNNSDKIDTLSPKYQSSINFRYDTNSSVSGYKTETPTFDPFENSTPRNDSHTSNSKSQDQNTSIPRVRNTTVISNDQSTTSRNMSQTKPTDAVHMQTTGFPAIESTTRKTNRSKFLCGKKRGRFSDEKDCRKFYICQGNDKVVEKACPINTVFSEINKQCTKNLSHCIRNNQFRCVTEGRFSDFLNDNIYYICVKNNQSHFIRFKLLCQNGYRLNKTSVLCVLNTRSTSTGDSSKSVSEQSSSSAKLENPKKKGTEESKFKCTEAGIFPDPSNCGKYFVCTHTNSSAFRQRRKRCDSDEIFHRDKKKCVDADSYEC